MNLRRQASMLETQGGFLCYSLEAEFFLQETSAFALEPPSTTCMSPTHITEANPEVS